MKFSAFANINMRSSNTSIDFPKMSASIATSSPGLLLSSTFKSEKKARDPGIEVAQNIFFVDSFEKGVLRHSTLLSSSSADPASMYLTIPFKSLIGT